MPFYRYRVEVAKTRRNDGTFLRGGWAQLYQNGGEVVVLSLQDKSVLEYRKVAPFLQKGRRHTAAAENGSRCRERRLNKINLTNIYDYIITKIG